jgi:WD40 repeat protein
MVFVQENMSKKT